MKNLNVKGFIFSVIIMMLSSVCFAQALKESRVHVQLNGTSTIHDWTMNSYHGDFTGTVDGSAIKNVKFVMESKSLQSNRKGMDANAYKALNANVHPNIIFEADEIKNGTVSGKLTINNVTKNISIDMTLKRTKGFYQIKGEKQVLMTDFNVTPPTFYNTVKTGNEVTIIFDVIVRNE